MSEYIFKNCNKGAFIINPDDPDYSQTDTAYGNKVRDALFSGKTVLTCEKVPASPILNTHPYDSQRYEYVFAFYASEDANGHFISLMLNQGFLDFRITVD